MSIEELEKLRRKAKNIVLIGALCSVVLALIVYYFTKLVPILIIFGIGGLALSFLISSKPSKQFTLAFKNAFVLKSLEAVFTNLNYEPEKGLPSAVISSTQMMYMGDRYSSNDFISAKYKDINVVQADVHIEEEHETTDSDGNTHTYWVTIFKGKWMIFDFNKQFKANLQVSQKGFGNSKVSNWGNELKYKKVMMEDQEFNDKFKINAQSEHEAFYILTPSLMEKIKNLSNTINGKILLCFIDNKLHVGIYNNDDSFEHSIFKAIDENKVVEEIAKDIKMITNFVDELDLDNDLFRREV